MKIKDLAFPQTYTQNGEERTRWIPVGAIFENDKGMSVKIDAIPVGLSQKDGWINAFDPKQKQDNSPPAANTPHQTPVNSPPVTASEPQDDFADLMPF